MIFEVTRVQVVTFQYYKTLHGDLRNIKRKSRLHHTPSFGLSVISPF